MVVEGFTGRCRHRAGSEKLWRKTRSLTSWVLEDEYALKVVTGESAKLVQAGGMVGCRDGVARRQERRVCVWDTAVWAVPAVDWKVAWCRRL